MSGRLSSTTRRAAFLFILASVALGLGSEFGFSFFYPPTTSATANDPQKLSSLVDKSPRYLDCSKIGDITIVRELGVGKQKIVYEVTLPSGVSAAAKRCNSRSCERERLLMREEYFYRTLYETFGGKTSAYYGYCPLSQVAGKEKLDPRALTEGSTLFIELGTPALPKWDNWEEIDDKELRPHSPKDLESLREIARQYDSFPGGALRLHGDNVYPHKYMRTLNGGELRHIDFDMVDMSFGASTLKENCEILLGGFAKLKEGDPRKN
jgi:hypothetical protein